MQILFLWVKKFECYRKQGFNLGGPFRFEYDYSTGILRKCDNPIYIEGFFDVGGNNYSAKVNNVTAIIGENGTGKTTFLRFIKRHFPEGQPGPSTPFVLVSTEKGQLHCYFTEGLKAKASPNIKLIQLKKTGEYFDKIDSMFSTSIVYFSNVFSGFDEEADVAGFKNVSSNFLARNVKRKFVENGLSDSKTSEIELFKQEEIEGQIAFLSSSHAKSLRQVLPNFFSKIPRQIVLSIKDLYFKNDLLNRMNEKPLQKTRNRDLQKLWPFLMSLLETARLTGVVRPIESTNIFIYNAIAHYLFEKCAYSSHPMHSMLIEMFNERIFSSKLGKDFNKNVESILSKVSELDEIMKDELKKHYNEYNVISDGFTRESKRLSIFVEGMKAFSRNFRPITKSTHLWLVESAKLLDFFSIYRQTYTFNGWLNFDWHEISTGELYFLGLLARFYKLAEGVNAGNELKKGILLLLDEPEIGLHPQWQKVFILAFLEFIRGIYSSRDIERDIQIIITGNQPILISDLPRTNVVFLEKMANTDYARVLSDQQARQRSMHTFGANIHDLYAHPFFMGDGFIGLFADKKIRECYEKIQAAIIRKKVLSLREAETISRCAESVDEPFISKSIMAQLGRIMCGSGTNEYEELLVRKKRVIEEELEKLQKRNVNATN